MLFVFYQLKMYQCAGKEARRDTGFHQSVFCAMKGVNLIFSNCLSLHTSGKRTRSPQICLSPQELILISRPLKVIAEFASYLCELNLETVSNVYTYWPLRILKGRRQEWMPCLGPAGACHSPAPSGGDEGESRVKMLLGRETPESTQLASLLKGIPGNLPCPCHHSGLLTQH